jgi:hypothetical protein
VLRNQFAKVTANITTGPNGESVRHPSMATRALILLDPEIVSAHVTVAMAK